MYNIRVQDTARATVEDGGVSDVSPIIQWNGYLACEIDF